MSILNSNKVISEEATSKNSIVIFYYPSGKIRAECTYRNNVLEGVSKHFFEDGKVRVKENYKNGKLEGLSKYYFENGQVEFEKYFKNGLLKYKNQFDKEGNLINKK